MLVRAMACSRPGELFGLKFRAGLLGALLEFSGQQAPMSMQVAGSLSRAITTWRFMASYKWVISPQTGVITIVTLLITPLTTSHEPPSSP